MLGLQGSDKKGHGLGVFVEKFHEGVGRGQSGCCERGGLLFGAGCKSADVAWEGGDVPMKEGRIGGWIGGARQLDRRGLEV